MSREEILNAISEMSVLELSELIKDAEEKFGVSAAAAVAVAAPTAGAAAEEDGGEEQTEFDVMLGSFGEKKVKTSKETGTEITFKPSKEIFSFVNFDIDKINKGITDPGLKKKIMSQFITVVIL